MVSFDHRTPGTSESEWAGDERWNSTRALDLLGVRSAVVVAAHPDDETLGAGGLMAMMHAQGTSIILVLATRGEASHSHDVSQQRVRECAEALAEIAPGAEILELGIPDGALREHRDVLRDGIRAAIRDAELIVAPWQGDGHRDHRIAGEVAVEIADEAGLAVLEYPVWMWHWAGPAHEDVPWDRFVTLELEAAARESKRSALTKYRSQFEVIAGGDPVIHGGMAAHFLRPFETFVTRA